MLGKPLLAYTVEAAIDSGLFGQVVVSTDSEAIAGVARSYGATVPFLRKEDLADDITPVSLATLDALERLDPEGNSYRYVAQLMPNCPLRTAEDVRESFKQFIQSGAPAQLSVARFGWQNPWWSMRRNAAYELTPLFETHITERSQDLPELFYPTGAIWWARADTLRQEKTFHVAGRTGWEIPWQRAADIDTEADWTMTELLMRLAEQRAEAYA
jgi:N-acylneuraminate cytidylyltransferase